MKTFRFCLPALVFIATIEMLYWPIIPKPGTVYHWWQIKWLAQAGYYLGCVPLGITVYLGGLGLAEDILVPVSWFLALAWSCLIYWTIGLIQGARHKGTSNRAL